MVRRRVVGRERMGGHVSAESSGVVAGIGAEQRGSLLVGEARQADHEVARRLFRQVEQSAAWEGTPFGWSVQNTEFIM